mgnify:FL=1
MTKIITRYFDSLATAKSVKHELVYRQRFSLRILDIYDSADGLAEKLERANVDPDTARTYEARMADGGAVMLVRATYKPLGVAKIARETMDDMGAMQLEGANEEVYIRDEPNLGLNVLTDHPLFLTRPRDPDTTTFHMANWPIPLISRNRPSLTPLIDPHTRMAKWPIPLISDRKPYTGSAFSRHARMANWPMPLISRRKPYTKSIFGRHARMASFPIPLLSGRKPYTGSVIGRHTRMANWPFPLLINGKPGTNALMPGGPRMANFPISLLSQRKPFTGSIIPRHARMARFPIPLISRRKPFTGSAIPRHGRMANFPIPLVIRRTNDTGPDSGHDFSLSKFLGIPTIIRRESVR